MNEEFTREEISDLRELLDQIQKVATDEDVLASEIGYKDNSVIIAKPECVKDLIREGLEKVEVEIE